MIRARFARAALLAIPLLALGIGSVSAHPNNTKTLEFELTCDDGNVWDARFNGGPTAFHIDDHSLYIWKQIDYVTPAGETGSIQNGMQGFSGAPLVICTYTGAISGNAYTVTGFYPLDR